MTTLTSAAFIFAILFPWFAICGGLGAFTGICVAKLLRRPIKHVGIDACLGIVGSVVAWLWYGKSVTLPFDDVTGWTHFSVLTGLIFPAAHQFLRSRLAYGRGPQLSK
jgi:hypothetical protein